MNCFSFFFSPKRRENADIRKRKYKCFITIMTSNAIVLIRLMCTSVKLHIYGRNAVLIFLMSASNFANSHCFFLKWTKSGPFVHTIYELRPIETVLNGYLWNKDHFLTLCNTKTCAFTSSLTTKWRRFDSICWLWLFADLAAHYLRGIFTMAHNMFSESNEHVSAVLEFMRCRLVWFEGVLDKIYLRPSYHFDLNLFSGPQLLDTQTLIVNIKCLLSLGKFCCFFFSSSLVWEVW